MNINPEKILIEDYTYELPPEFIANFPLEKRDNSMLLIYKNGVITEEIFFKLREHLDKGTTLILNNTRVIEARILFTKDTGAKIEIFCLEPYRENIEQSLQQKGNSKWNCLIGGASKWKPGQVLQKKIFVDNKEVVLTATYLDKRDESFIIEFNWEPTDISFIEVLHKAGAIPLPPYIKRAAEEKDSDRYQTVFGTEEGSVAAPTAALHFTDNVFKNLTEKGISTSYVTLHVGAGTFKPVKAEAIADHHMHYEVFSVGKETLNDILSSDKIVAVGTTSLRTIESLYWLGVKLKMGVHEDDFIVNQWDAYQLDDSISVYESLHQLILWLNDNNQNEIRCRTGMIIVPGYDFKIIKGLITNFHQPRSTLLLLVAAFVGEDWKKIYQHALNNNYRFLSYGDSSLLWRE